MTFIARSLSIDPSGISLLKSFASFSKITMFLGSFLLSNFFDCSIFTLSNDLINVLFNNLREEKGWTYGSYSGISESYKTKGYFIAQAQVRNEVADSAAVELLMEVDKMRNTLVSEDELSSAKAKYTGNFVMSLEDPSTIAGFARNIITQDLPENYYNSFLEKINSVTKEDVKNAAEKYFLTNNTRVFVTGKGSEIIDALEGLEYNGKELTIRYFDKFGNETSKPNYTVSADVSAESIVSNYINSIGGRDRLEEF